MKKHQIQAIAKIRKLLTDNLHTGGAMVETIKANLDDTMSYEMENLMDDGRQMAQRIRIYDAATDGNFDIATLEYEFTDCNPRCSDDSLTESELWELQELMIHHACDFNPLHDGYVREDI